MAGEPPPEVNGPPVGPEAQGAGGGPKPPEPLTPEKTEAAEAQAAKAAGGDTAGLHEIADDQPKGDFDWGGKGEPLREAPPAPGPPGATTRPEAPSNQQAFSEYVNLIRNAPDREARLAQIKAPALRAQVEEALAADEVGPAQQPPEATGAGDGEPPEQPESQNVETAANAISREVTAEAQRQERYARMPQTQRDKNLQIQEGVLEKLQTRRSLTLDQAEIDAIDLLTERATNEISSIQSAPPPPEGTNGASLRVTQEELQAATRHIDTQVEDLSQLSKTNVENLTAEKGSEEAKLESLNRMLEGPVTNAEKVAVQARIRDSEARIKAINELRGKKEPEEQKTLRETEDKTRAEEFAKVERERASAADLQERINEDNGLFGELQTKIKKQEDIINDASKTEEDKKQATAILSGLQQRAKEVGDRLKTNEDAIKEARKRVRDEFTLTEGFSEADLREVSREQYREMTDQEAAKYLNEVRKAFPKLSDHEFNTIRRNILAASPLGIKDRAQFAEYFAQKLIKQEGRNPEDFETMRMLVDRYPEMAKYVMDKVAENNDQIKAFKEQNPDGWEKMWKFAGRNKHWLLILLAIIAGGAAAGVGVVAGPIAGGLAGAGSAGAAGGGAGYFGSRRAA